MRNFFKPSSALLIFSSFLLLFHFPALAIDEIQIENVNLQEKSANEFVLTGDISNKTPETREVILRFQMAVYDKAAPKGDLPVMILRKDITVVLKSGESRNVSTTLLNEGSTPKGSLRFEPLVRIRRQRPWNY